MTTPRKNRFITSPSSRLVTGLVSGFGSRMERMRRGKSMPVRVGGQGWRRPPTTSWDDAGNRSPGSRRRRMPIPAAERSRAGAARGGTQTRYWWATSFRSTWPTAGTADGHRGCRAAAQALEEASRRTRSACTTWAAASTNGSKTAGTGIIRCPDQRFGVGRRRGLRKSLVWLSPGGTTRAMWRPSNRESYGNARYPTHGFRIALSP